MKQTVSEFLAAGGKIKALPAMNDRKRFRTFKVRNPKSVRVLKGEK